MLHRGSSALLGSHQYLAGIVMLVLIAQGMSNAQISDTQCIAGETTRTHIKRILAKLGCPTARRPS